MKTEIISILPTDPLLTEKLKAAGEIIKKGGLVVFPTETVYGLGADGTSESAAKKIYAAKGRPSDNPLIIHISEPSMAEEYTYTNETYYSLANLYMPGPITIVLRAKETVPLATRGGLDTVAVRCPVNPIARELIRSSGVPIAAPSANISGTPSPTESKHVIRDMQGRVDMIIDGGDSEIGLESTIVSIESDGSLTLLRPGKITPDELMQAGFTVTVAESVLRELGEGERALSPGMKYKHYAPSSPLILLEGDGCEAVKYIKSRNEENICIISYTEELPIFSKELPNAAILDFGSRDSQSEQARRLFKLLRQTDEENYSRIYAPLPGKNGMGLALYNRMIRAAAHKIIRL